MAIGPGVGEAGGVARPRLVTVALAVLAALVGVAVLAARPGPAPVAERTPRPAASGTPAPLEPAVVKDCWVPAGGGVVSLTSEEAKALTTAAARTRDTARGEAALRRAVDDRLAVTPAEAAVVTASLLGRRATQRLTCSYARMDVEPQEAGDNGLTPRAQALRRAWTDVFGPLVAGGFSAGGVSTGHVDSSSHYDGRAIDVFFRPLGDPDQRRAGRVFAQWLVAHAQDYSVLSVIFADQIWTSWASFVGWREYVHPSGNRTNAVLRHLDHVHVAVESGEPWRGR